MKMFADKKTGTKKGAYLKAAPNGLFFFVVPITLQYIFAEKEVSNQNRKVNTQIAFYEGGKFCICIKRSDHLVSFGYLEQGVAVALAVEGKNIGKIDYQPQGGCVHNDTVISPHIVFYFCDFDATDVQVMIGDHDEQSTAYYIDRELEIIYFGECKGETGCEKDRNDYKWNEHRPSIFRCNIFDYFNKFQNNIFHSNKNFCDVAKIVKINSYPRKMAINFCDKEFFSRGGNFFRKNMFYSIKRKKVMKKFGTSKTICNFATELTMPSLIQVLIIAAFFISAYSTDSTGCCMAHPQKLWG